MNDIRNAVLTVLYDMADEDDKLISNLTALVKKHGDVTYSIIFHILTHLELEPSEAQKCWGEILAHKEIMGYSLGRSVSLRTAVCDYFCSVNKLLRNPKIIEIQKIKTHVDAGKFDNLTGLYTRDFFDSTIEKEMARSKRYETELSLVMIDVDDLSKVNSTYGHMAGDSILKKIGQIINKEIRNEDFSARYSGGEIALMLPETGKMRAKILAERIRERIEEIDYYYKGTTFRVTVSGGLASFPIDAIYASNLIVCAQEALHTAKKAGKNRIAFYSQDKRRFVRIKMDASIKVQKIGFSDQSFLKAKGKNISIDGILFQSDRPLEIGTKIQLSIPIDTIDRPLHIIGTVVRIEVFNSSKYEIGVSFLEVDNKSKADIAFFTF